MSLPLPDSEVDQANCFAWALSSSITVASCHQLGTIAESYVRMSVASLNADVLSAHDHDTLLDAFVTQDACLAEQETLHHLELVESTIVEALTDLR